MSFIDLTGLQFGRLTVIKRAENAKNRHVRWLCKCECGGTTISHSCDLKSGRAKSCGCLNRENLDNKTHGMTGTRIYRIWQAMKYRCCNKNHTQYKDYGGRGIKVCDEWLNSFEAFYEWAVANGYSDNLTIDRIYINGNYEPSNCKWATRKEQANNTRRNHLITYKGKTQTIAQWEIETNISAATIEARLKRGWNVERTLETK